MSNLGSMDLAIKLKSLVERIEGVCGEIKKDPKEIELLPVTKGKDVNTIKALQELGFNKYGENYIQEIKLKQPLLESMQCVLIGSLQRNKARHAVALCQSIMSLDSEDLYQRIAREEEAQGRQSELWLQVDLWNQETKSGCPESQAQEMIAHLVLNTAERFKGITILPPQGEPNAFGLAHRFRNTLQDLFQRRFLLSMGMSDDFEQAIREGSDHIRIGSALLGPR